LPVTTKALILASTPLLSRRLNGCGQSSRKASPIATGTSKGKSDDAFGLWVMTGGPYGRLALLARVNIPEHLS
jgi:hypothetical protein